MAICRLIVKYSLIFPGQASQRVGMGSDLIGRWPEAARIYDIAEDAAGIPVGKLCFEGPEEELVRTANLQPCVVATSLAILAAAYSEANLNIGDCFASAPFPPFAVAGHSVGEYSALAAAGVITISTCLSLVAERARLMQRAADSNPGTMLALLGGTVESAEELCSAIRLKVPGSYLQVANLNSSGETVIAGDLPGIEMARRLASEYGSRRAIPLSVSGAFHSPAMAPAAHGLRRVVSEAVFSEPVMPIVGNIDAAMMSDMSEVREELAEQIVSPVRWAESMTTISASGVTCFYEVGPGQVLSRLAKRIVPDIRCEAVGTAKAVPKLAAYLIGLGVD